MTNQEAKKKVCPISRLDCLGDRCAVWVWIETRKPVYGLGYDAFTDMPKNQWQGRCGFVR